MTTSHENLHANRTEDANLLTRAQAGDQSAMIVFYRYYEPRVRRTVQRVLGRDLAKDVDDVVQDVLVQAIRAWNPTAGKPVVGWIGTIALNMSRNHYRSVRREVLTDSTDNTSFEHELTSSLTPEEEALAREGERLVLQVLDEVGLSEHENEAFQLRALYGLSFEEAARHAETTVKAMQERHGRAVRKLRDHQRKLAGFLAFLLAIRFTDPNPADAASSSSRTWSKQQRNVMYGSVGVIVIVFIAIIRLFMSNDENLTGAGTPARHSMAARAITPLSMPDDAKTMTRNSTQNSVAFGPLGAASVRHSNSDDSGLRDSGLEAVASETPDQFAQIWASMSGHRIITGQPLGTTLPFPSGEVTIVALSANEFLMHEVPPFYTIMSSQCHGVHLDRDMMMRCWSQSRRVELLFIGWMVRPGLLRGNFWTIGVGSVFSQSAWQFEQSDLNLGCRSPFPTPQDGWWDNHPTVEVAQRICNRFPRHPVCERSIGIVQVSVNRDGAVPTAEVTVAANEPWHGPVDLIAYNPMPSVVEHCESLPCSIRLVGDWPNAVTGVSSRILIATRPDSRLMLPDDGHVEFQARGTRGRNYWRDWNICLQPIP